MAEEEKDSKSGDLFTTVAAQTAGAATAAAVTSVAGPVAGVAAGAAVSHVVRETLEDEEKVERWANGYGAVRGLNTWADNGSKKDGD